jgi:RimJ/RimL family protein N-acetyltransferase
LVTLRQAREADARTLWEWANDREVRSQSFDERPFPWDAHVSWLADKLASPRCRIYVVENESGEPVGQVRFDLQDDETAMIDFSVQADARGRGYGSEGLRIACHRAFADLAATSVVGLVKPANHASLRAFQRAGFDEDGVELVGSQRAMRMALARHASGDR